MDEDKKTDSFHVSDKRRFVADEAGAVAEEGKGQSQAREPFKTPPPSGETQAKTGTQEEGLPFPEIDFSTLVLSLSSSAIVHLGLVENPHTRTMERDLSLAKQTIDIIGMLKEKTKGNLTSEEQNLVENLLTDLRLKYITELKKA
jgi:hypothetical protein